MRAVQRLPRLGLLCRAATSANFPSICASNGFCKSIEDRRNQIREYSTKPRLVPIGKLEAPRAVGSTYETGQMFLHRVFGYRGVILFPWEARVHDKNKPNPEIIAETPSRTDTSPGAEQVDSRQYSKVSEKMYYQVLIHQDDRPFLSMPSEEGFTVFQPKGSKGLYTIQGVDFVSHDEIFPYSTHEPLEHKLFKNFFEPAPQRDPSFVGSDFLKQWSKKYLHLLEASAIYRETTEDIRVTALPLYIGFRENPQSSTHYFWRYTIRLENFGNSGITLRDRHWHIFSISGTLETTKGRGVVGYEPHLTPEVRAFQYSSHLSLAACSGHMWGVYKMERDNGKLLEVKIPSITLESVNGN